MSERGVSGIVGDDEWNTVRIGSGFVLQCFGARYLTRASALVMMSVG